MTKLRGGTQLSQSGIGLGVSVKFRTSLGLDDGCSMTVYGNLDRLYMVRMAIYRKWQNELSTEFIPLSVSNQSEFPLANHLLSSDWAFLQGE